MDPSNDPVLTALETLSRVPSAGLEPYRTKAVEVFHNLRQFVEGCHPSISALTNALDLSSEEIKTFLIEDPDSSLRTGTIDAVSPEDEDPRVFDLQVNRKSLEVRFRKGLSQISLASAYSVWEGDQENRSETTVHALVQDLSALEKRKRLSIKEFLDHNTDIITNQRVALDGIKHGIKCLVFQELFGYSGVLAILSFVYHHFRSVNFEELQALRNALASVSWIVQLAKEKTPWYEACRRAYEGMASYKRIKSQLKVIFR
ncbi:MAG: hypothetical protein L6R36_007875 [Xanthoria steineri]|nr:MAG: hypothetical protein L6R36_007875 [Xanthoria steineri]